MSKGVIVRYLCTNPSCSYSDKYLKYESSVNQTATKFSFKVLNFCPKCKSNVELLNFVSADIELIEDKINIE